MCETQRKPLQRARETPKLCFHQDQRIRAARDLVRISEVIIGTDRKTLSRGAGEGGPSPQGWVGEGCAGNWPRFCRGDAEGPCLLGLDPLALLLGPARVAREQRAEL